MLHRRLISATFILIALVGLCCLDVWWNLGRPGLWLMPLAIAINVLCTYELLGLLRAQNLHPIGWLAYTGTLAVFLSASVPLVWKSPGTDDLLDWSEGPLCALAIGVTLALLAEVLRYKKPGAVTIHVALSVFSMTYIGLMMSFFIALRLRGDANEGLLALLSFVIVVKLSDVGAYFVGTLIGRHKLVPQLSPNKTVEGAIGGLAASTGGALLAFLVLAPRLSGDSAELNELWRVIAYGMIVGMAGMIGDLAESLVKRDMEQKDSGQWLPGMGGVLDVMDSLLIAAPVAYLCWKWGLVN